MEEARQKSVSMFELPGARSTTQAPPSGSPALHTQQRLNATVGTEVPLPPSEAEGAGQPSLLGRMLGLFSRKSAQAGSGGGGGGGGGRGGWRGEREEEGSAGLADIL